MFPLRDDIPSQRFPVVTLMLIALNVVSFLFELLLGPNLQEFLLHWAIVPVRYTLPEVAQLFSFPEQVHPAILQRHAEPAGRPQPSWRHCVVGAHRWFCLRRPDVQCGQGQGLLPTTPRGGIPMVIHFQMSTETRHRNLNPGESYEPSK